ncbi:MAG: hypothetical protein RLZZ272_704 [Actinomycetota bacterium]
MGHDEDVGLETLGDGSQERELRARLGVTREQHPTAGVARPQHDRRLVRFAPSVGERAPGWWREHLQGEIGEDDRATGDRDDHRHASGRGRLARSHRVRSIRPDGRHPHGTHRDPLQDRRGTADMVRMGVRDDEEVDAAPILPYEPVRCTVVLPRIDEDPDPGGLEEQRVPLADVDRGERERRVRGRGAVRRGQSRDAPGEHEGEQQDRHAAILARFAPRPTGRHGTCGYRRASGTLTSGTQEPPE